MLRAGQIVVATTNTFALADHQIIRTLIYPHSVLTIHMSFEQSDLPGNTDLSFLESNDLKLAARRIVEKMEEIGILL
jgi:bifunctional enzyme CysN/CysC